MMLRNYFVVITLISLLSCSKSDSVDGTIQALSLSNVSYGPDPSHKIDIFLPAGRSQSSTKVLILIHGGGWTTGDKLDFLPFVDTFKRRLPTFAIFNINYRLSANPSNLFPAQEMDVKSAVEFIYSKRSEYGISDKFIIGGASAGGHLAMLQAYKYTVPVKIKTVVSFFGPSDLTEMYNNPVGGNATLSFLLAQAIGKTPAQDPLLYSNSSPLTWITSGSAVPTILLHGGLDPLVRPSQSIAVSNKLSLFATANEYVPYPTGGHGDWNNSMYHHAFNRIVNFLDIHVP